MKIIEPEQANCNTTNNQTQTASWRQRLRIHPAAELFPLDSDDIRVLADDIRQYGLQEPVSVIKDGNGYVLLDGRNRLDAMEMAGITLTVPWERRRHTAVLNRLKSASAVRRPP